MLFRSVTPTANVKMTSRMSIRISARRGRSAAAVRRADIPQLASSMAEIWDEVLPPTPEAVWRDNVVRVAEAMQRG